MMMRSQPTVLASSEQGIVSPKGRPLSPRTIHREHLRYHNQIALKRSELVFSWLSQQWKLAVTPIERQLLNTGESVIVDWGGASMHLRLEPALVNTALRNAVGIDAPPEVAAELRAILIEAAFADLATAFESSQRKRFRLVESAPMEPVVPVKGGLPDAASVHPHGFCVKLSDGETDFLCEAWTDELGLGFVANALRDFPLSRSSGEMWDSLPILVQIAAGWTTLEMSTIRTLNIHDVVLMDECLVGGEIDKVFLRIGRRFGVSGELSESTIKITDWLEEIMDEYDGYDEDNREADAAEGQAGVLDQIPVRLHFDLGERTMPLADLKRLGPGYVLELGRELRRAVTIRANGKKIGEGELVDIDGYLGVSILSIAPPSD